VSGSRTGFESVLGRTWRSSGRNLTAPDFVRAIEKAQSTCLLPFGVVEKHGPHLPLNVDTINSRHVAVNAAQQEYAVVFPEYFFSQIEEARHQPGTIAYSSRLMWEVFQETTAEMSRNGCKKIIAIPGHGGNTNMLQYFCAGAARVSQGLRAVHLDGEAVRQLLHRAGPQRTVRAKDTPAKGRPQPLWTCAQTWFI